MWWLYFTEAEHLDTREIKRVFVWGYGHFFIFAAGAAVGAGVGVLVDLLGSSSAALAAHDSGHNLGSENASGHLNYPGLAVSIPIGIYITGLWFVRDRFLLNRPHHWGLLGFALVIALSGFLPAAPIPSAVILLVCLILRLRNQRAYDGVSSTA